MFSDLMAALALVMVIEGMMPFLNPGRFKQTLHTVGQCRDSTLRWAGLVFMLLGVGLLYLVR